MEALQEEARRQAEEIMADAAKASAHAESDFKPTAVPREGEVRLSCVADETGAMHCEYPGAFDGETPIHTPKHGDKKKSHRESTSSKKVSSRVDASLARARGRLPRGRRRARRTPANPRITANGRSSARRSGSPSGLASRFPSPSTLSRLTR